MTTLAEKYSKYFPLKGEVTEAIIQEANIYDTEKCIGALTLRAALGNKLKSEDLLTESLWGDTNGSIDFIDMSKCRLSLERKRSMMFIKKPCSVVFILR